MTSKADIAAIFIRDIANHEMNIVHDFDGFRHVVFASPGSSCYAFALTTWPGHLAITGDMGDYVFCRLPDMFQFFRPDASLSAKAPHGIYINPGYWAEKCVAAPKNIGVEAYNPEAFAAAVKAQVEEFLVSYRKEYDNNYAHFNLDEEDADAVYGNFSRALLLHAACTLTGEYGEDAALLSVRDFYFDYSFWGINDLRAFTYSDIFSDFEPHLREYTHHYLWCLCAIVWGIAQYDKARVG